MRLRKQIIGLFALAIITPAFARADAPSLATYTISNDTIYPGAPADSGLATTTAIDISFSEQVKASIKIVSAGGATIKSLYSSSSVTNPTPKIWDGMNSSGARVSDGTYTVLISATSTATGETMADASKAIIVASPDDPPPASPPAAEPPALSSSSGSSEYIPIPTLRIVAEGDRTVSSGADTTFTAAMYDGNGNRRDDALVAWTFGDGMQRMGARVLHRYYHPGAYLVVVRATTSDGGEVRKEIRLIARDAGIRIVSVSAQGIELENKDTRALDLSLWRLSAGGNEFKLPEGTQILVGSSVVFPPQITGLLAVGATALLYPSGEVAATYPDTKTPSGEGQPSTPAAGYKRMQKVEQISGTKRNNAQSYEEAVNAPAAATGLAAAGAALPPAENEPSGSFNLFRSPWTLGLFGVIALAGAAFIFI